MSTSRTPDAHGGEPRVSLELPVVLPEVDGHDDQCIERLVERLEGLRGITSAHLDGDDTAGSRLCLHYDPNLVALAQVERLARDAGTALTRRYRHETLLITNMDCGDCAQSIEHVVRRIDGVLQVSVSYAAEKMRVEFDSERVSRNDIEARVASMGYEVRTDLVELDLTDFLLELDAGTVTSGPGWGLRFAGVLPHRMGGDLLQTMHGVTFEVQGQTARANHAAFWLHPGRWRRAATVGNAVRAKLCHCGRSPLNPPWVALQ